MYRIACLVIAALLAGACATPNGGAMVSPAEPVDEQPGNAASEGTVADDTVSADNNESEPGIVMPHRDSQRVCVRERRTGSNRARTVCRTRAEIEEERVRSKQTFEGIRRSQEHIEQ